MRRLMLAALVAATVTGPLAGAANAAFTFNPGFSFSSNFFFAVANITAARKSFARSVSPS